jgi:hypothetical protein
MGESESFEYDGETASCPPPSSETPKPELLAFTPTSPFETSALKRFGSSKFGNASSADDAEIESSSSRLGGDVLFLESPEPVGFNADEDWFESKLKFNCKLEIGLEVAILVLVTVVAAKY